MGDVIQYTENAAKYSNYQDFKQSLDAVVEEVEAGFVQIGYYLKVARDTDILRESGYGNMNDFAEAEYGLDKSAVSRFMAINDRFSENGYSPQLRECYRGIGRAKLSMMLTLPDAVNEEITPAYSKADVQKIKNEVEEEQKITDLEVLMERRDEIAEQMENNLQRIMYQIGHDIPSLYRKLWDADMNTPGGEGIEKKIMDAMAPAGEGMISARLQGIGKMMLCLRGADQDVTLVNVRSQEKEKYTWRDMWDALDIIMVEESPEKSWEYVYGEKFPEVAPVQPEKKPSKVVTAPKEKPDGKNREAGGNTLQESNVAAGVPEEIGPEKLPRGEKWNGESWKEPEKKEWKPVELPAADAQYGYPVGKTLAREIRGGLRFLILRTKDPYRVGNILHLQEHNGGEETGEVLDIKITFLIDDHGGLTPGYVALQFELLPPAEKEMEGQMRLEEMMNFPEEGSTDEEDDTPDGICSEGQESDT